MVKVKVRSVFQTFFIPEKQSENRPHFFCLYFVIFLWSMTGLCNVTNFCDRVQKSKHFAKNDVFFCYK
ncbi:hypothetical protein HMPREF9996_00768 [Aggregatibacter actinomycetemcomitans Y4]|nr:hypothetical protein HMPREF9996_00768 [Aggregatibacter actinomycetemcomitans Y4]